MRKKLLKIFLLLSMAGTFCLTILAANAGAAEYTHDYGQNSYWGESEAWSGTGSIPGIDDIANLMESIILGYWDEGANKAVYENYTIGILNLSSP